MKQNSYFIQSKRQATDTHITYWEDRKTEELVDDSIKELLSISATESLAEVKLWRDADRQKHEVDHALWVACSFGDKVNLKLPLCLLLFRLSWSCVRVFFFLKTLYIKLGNTTVVTARQLTARPPFLERERNKKSLTNYTSL